MNITVAICCYNSEKVLDKTLKKLREFTPSNIPVLVIDDCSSDKTGTIAKKYSSEVVRHNVNRGYGWARQSAVENCQTEIIAFIDDSCLVAPNWYDKLVENWEQVDEVTQAVIGKMEIFEPTSFLQKFVDRNNPFLPLPLSFSRNNSLLKKVQSYLVGKEDVAASYISGFSNGNASFRKASLDKVGGYDRRYRLGAEDEDIAARLQDAFGDSALYYDPSVKVYHDSTYSLRSLLRRNYKYGKSAAFRFDLEKGIPLIQPIPAAAILILCLALIFNVTALFYILLGLITLFYLPRTKTKFVTDAPIIFILEFAHLVGFGGAILRNNFNTKTDLSYE
jgi:glycosyltransferase involved in cell wall biosynthesis